MGQSGEPPHPVPADPPHSLLSSSLLLLLLSLPRLSLLSALLGHISEVIQSVVSSSGGCGDVRDHLATGNCGSGRPGPAPARPARIPRWRSVRRALGGSADMTTAAPQQNRSCSPVAAGHTADPATRRSGVRGRQSGDTQVQRCRRPGHQTTQLGIDNSFHWQPGSSRQGGGAGQPAMTGH